MLDIIRKCKYCGYHSKKRKCKYGKCGAYVHPSAYVILCVCVCVCVRACVRACVCVYNNNKTSFVIFNMQYIFHVK